MSGNTIKDEWLYWFDRLDTDEAIRRAAYSPAIPIEVEPYMSAGEVCKKLDAAFREIFLPEPQHVEILRTLVDQAVSFSRSTYPTLNAYNRQRSGGVERVSELPPILCLTGLGGASKSSLVKAFQRICQVAPDKPFVADGQRLTLHPVQRIAIQAHLSVHAVLRNLANPLAVAGNGMSDTSDLLNHVHDWLQAICTGTVVLDELQFFTQSSTASTRTAQLIMTLASLGIPLVYVANYSLVNKLMKRPQEETDRLLSSPIILEPSAADSVYWTEVVKEYLSVSPQHFRLDPTASAQELHRLTAGIFRKLRLLLLNAYRVAVERGSSYVTMDEVRLAYRSRQFSAHRKDVEDLASLAVSSLVAERRPDLVCPFKSLGSALSRTTSTPSVVTFIESPRAMLESTISKEAQATLKALRREANQPPGKRTLASVTRLPRSIPVSAESLHQGAQLLRGALAKPLAPSSCKLQATSEEQSGHNHGGSS